MSDLDQMILDILALNHKDKLLVIDKILASIYPPNYGVDKVWERESEERIAAHNQGQLSMVDANELFAKYEH